MQQGFINLIYSTWLHNADALAYLVGIGLMIVLAFKNPTRVRLLFLFGFIFLLLRFEYLKHFVDPIQQQTIAVVVTQEGQFQAKRLIDIFLNDFINVMLYVLGWGSLFVAIIFGNKKHD